jgi:hypothetical protein
MKIPSGLGSLVCTGLPKRAAFFTNVMVMSEMEEEQFG